MPWTTGVNMREFAYYATAAAPLTSPGLGQQQLERLKTLSAKVVRFYAASRHHDPAACIEQVRRALDMLAAKDMKGIVCLTDSLNSGFSLAGDAPYHAGPYGHLVKPYWHSQRYEAHYIPFIEQLSFSLGNHPALLLWELGNEFAIHPQPATPEDTAAFFRFAERASSVLKNNSPTVPVSTGLVGVHHIAPEDEARDFGLQLYALDSIDAISIHYYADDKEKTNAYREAAIAKELDKAFYIGEFGALSTMPQRPRWYRQQLEAWRQAGALMALPWAFDVSLRDVGIADEKSMSARFADFIALRHVLREHASPDEPSIPLARATTSALRFRVVSAVGVRVRSAPRLGSDTVLGNHFLSPGDEITLISKDAPLADGFVWRQHAQGWSAERSADGSKIFMQHIPPHSESSADSLVFEVVAANGLRVRSAPSLGAQSIIPNALLPTGAQVAVLPGSRQVADGFVWWRHAQGWSAERAVTGERRFMIRKT